MTLVERFVDWLVGDSCPADPCASSNGVKTRVFAAILGPAVILVLVGSAFPPASAVAQGLLVTAVIWASASTVFVTREIDEMEPCDDVDEHHGEGSA